MAIQLTVDRVLEEKKMTRYEVAKQTGIGYPIIDKYYKNKVVRYDSYVLDRLCSCLNCQISDLILFTKDN